MADDRPNRTGPVIVWLARRLWTKAKDKPSHEQLRIKILDRRGIYNRTSLSGHPVSVCGVACRYVWL